VTEFARQNAEEVVEEALPLCALAGEGRDNTAERYQQVTRRFPNARVGSARMLEPDFKSFPMLVIYRRAGLSIPPEIRDRS
jgi:hypothetical protein